MASTLTPYVPSLSGLTGTANNAGLSWASAATYAFSNITPGMYVAGIFDTHVHRWFYSCYSASGPYGIVNLPTVDNPTNLPFMWGATNPYQQQDQNLDVGIMTSGSWFFKITYAITSPDNNSPGFFELSQSAQILISSSATGQT